MRFPGSNNSSENASEEVTCENSKEGEHHELKCSEGKETGLLFPISGETVLNSQSSLASVGLVGEGLGDKVTVDYSNKKPYGCSLCVKRFESMDSFIRHTRIHHNKCQYCDELFTTKTKLNFHIMRQHATTQSKKCCICGRSFAWIVMLLHHIEMEHVRTICPICGASFQTKLPLKNHILVHIQCRPFSCSRCNDTFETESCLTWHLAHHDEAMICEICGKNRRTKKALDSHLIRHVISNPYTCCSRWFRSKPRVVGHMLEHGKDQDYSCDKCSSVFPSEYGLIKHRLIHTESTPNPYGQCGTTNLLPTSLVAPIKKHFRRNCSICKKKFKNQEDLEQHFVMYHYYHVPNKFTCKICGKGLSTKSGLESHMGIHSVRVSNETQLCKICGVEFKTKEVLKEHRKTHNDEELLSCRVCLQKFTTSALLEIHFGKFHVHECKHCLGSFLTHSILRKHSIRIHGKSSLRLKKHSIRTHQKRTKVQKGNSTITSITSSDVKPFTHCQDVPVENDTMERENPALESVIKVEVDEPEIKKECLEETYNWNE